jgi:hypothetical protein
MIAGCAAARGQTVSPASPSTQPTHPTATPDGTATQFDPNAPLTAQSSIDQILHALDQRGKTLKDFTANVTLSHSDVAQGNGDELTGRMWMQRLAGNDARLRVIFNTRQVNDEKPRNDKQEYELANGWLTDRSYTDHKEIRRQVLKPGQKMDLLKLGEGPFPLPLGQDPAEVKRQFEVARLPAKPSDPAGTIHVRLTPKPGTRFASKFEQIDFWVDPASEFPIKIETLDPNETTLTTATLSDIKVNSGLGDGDFKLPQIDEKQWHIQVAPFED